MVPFRYTRQKKMECEGNFGVQYLQISHPLKIFREGLICEANISGSSGLISHMFILKKTISDVKGAWNKLP